MSDLKRLILKLIHYDKLAFILLIIYCNHIVIKSSSDDTLNTQNQQILRPQTNQKNLNICPQCGMDSSNPKKEKGLHKIIECEKFNNSITSSVFNKYMPSYKCKCKYLRVNEKACQLFSRNLFKNPAKKFENLFVGLKASDFMNEEDQLDSIINDSEEYDLNEDQTTKVKKPLHIINECLIVHVGMAIKGHNLMYKQWISKENCFNLCINTTIKNGFSFDCKSFEHWHSDCASNPADIYKSATNRTKSAVCATFVATKSDHDRLIKRANNKIDYCVLSNQNIQMAGKNFAENLAVTYYEILCKRKIRI